MEAILVLIGIVAVITIIWVFIKSGQRIKMQDETFKELFGSPPYEQASTKKDASVVGRDAVGALSAVDKNNKNKK